MGEGSQQILNGNWSRKTFVVTRVSLTNFLPPVQCSIFPERGVELPGFGLRGGGMVFPSLKAPEKYFDRLITIYSCIFSDLKEGGKFAEFQSEGGRGLG